MILITGCSGYIGRHLALCLLNKGEKIRGLVLPGEESKLQHLIAKGLEIWTGDITNPETLKGIEKKIDGVYHLTGLHSNSIKKMEDVYAGGLRNMVNIFKNTLCNYFVISGNHSIYEGNDPDELLAENSLTVPVHPFGKISLLTEEIALNAFTEYQLPIIILRIAEVYGNGEYNFIKQLEQGMLSVLGDGSNWSSRIHIEDLVQILMQIADINYQGLIFNVADHLPIRLKNFYTILNRQYKINLPKFIDATTVPERIKLSIHGLRSLSLRLSNKAVVDIINYQFLYPTFHEGISSLLDEANPIQMKI